jgi:hypothetical protein
MSRVLAGQPRREMGAVAVLGGRLEAEIGRMDLLAAP